MRRWILPTIIMTAVYLAFSGEWFTANKGVVFAFVSEKFRGASEVDYLRDKNKQLEIEVLRLKSAASIILSDSTGHVKAKVFSSYPFSDRSEIIISVGSKSGVKVGAGVTSGNFLVGRVSEVGRDLSVVQTIFDRNFKIPARIGEKEINALYVGGLEPRLEMIDAKNALPCCEMVLSADAKSPYGLGIGRTKKMAGDLVKTADVEPLFDIKNLRDVTVVIN